MSLTLLGGSALTPISYALLAGFAGTLGREVVLVGGGLLAMLVLVAPLVLPDFRHLDDSWRVRDGQSVLEGAGPEVQAER
jgi:hypothetical protein